MSEITAVEMYLICIRYHSISLIRLLFKSMNAKESTVFV